MANWLSMTDGSMPMVDRLVINLVLGSQQVAGVATGLIQGRVDELGSVCAGTLGRSCTCDG